MQAESRLERSRRTAPSGSFTAPGSDPTDEALRAWRLERSRADGVPAYVVLSNATVAEIASAQPRNPRELSRISGIGPTKLERYGEDILRIVNSSLAAEPADL
jgi:superfamily II DNA helicase RecQ